MCAKKVLISQGYRRYLRGTGLGNSYGMMIFFIRFWCCALESAQQRLSAIKIQTRIVLSSLENFTDCCEIVNLQFLTLCVSGSHLFEV